MICICLACIEGFGRCSTDGRTVIERRDLYADGQYMGTIKVTAPPERYPSDGWMFANQPHTEPSV